MSDTQNLPKITHTSISGNLEPLHEELEATFKRFEAELGEDRPNRIAGRDDYDGERYEVFSPLDRSCKLGGFFDASEAAVGNAVAAARRAATGWGTTRWTERVEALRTVAKLLDERKLDIAAALVFEVGKPRLDAMGELGEAVGMIEFYCDEIERRDGFDGSLKEAGVNETAQSVMRPFGVFACITPFNFPVALVCNTLSGAILGGNTVVLKPSPASGLTASLVVKAFEDAGLPEGVVNMVCGKAAGRKLSDAPGVDGFAFIGSYEVGTQLLRKAAAGPFMRPVIGEMGGKNPAYVGSTADVEEAARGIARSAFFGAGQKCTCCSVAYIHSSIYDAFVERLVATTAALRTGNTLLDREVQIGPLINETALARYADTIDHAASVGRVIHGGQRILDGDLDRGLFVKPAIVEVPPGDRLLSGELFVPVLALSRFDDIEDAIDRGNAVVYGLSAGYYGNDREELDLFLSRAEAGIHYVNRPHGATTGGWPGIQSLTGWKGSGMTWRGALGPHYVGQYMREQCRTIRWHE